MSDLIDRQAAIDALEKVSELFPWKVPGNRDSYDSYNEAWNDAIGRAEIEIEELSPAQPEQRWVPCSEGLPEVHETGNSFSGVYMQSYPVLVYGVPEGEEECGFHVVTYCDDLNGCTYWSTELDEVTIDGVRAWMPLPEPYREGKE